MQGLRRLDRRGYTGDRQLSSGQGGAFSALCGVAAVCCMLLRCVLHTCREPSRTRGGRVAGAGARSDAKADFPRSWRYGPTQRLPHPVVQHATRLPCHPLKPRSVHASCHVRQPVALAHAALPDLAWLLMESVHGGACRCRMPGARCVLRASCVVHVGMQAALRTGADVRQGTILELRARHSW